MNKILTLGLACSSLSASLISFQVAEAANFSGVSCTTATLGDVAYDSSPFASCSGAIDLAKDPTKPFNPTVSTNFLNGVTSATDYKGNTLTGPIFGGISDWIYDSKIEDTGKTGTDFLGFNLNPIGERLGEWGFSNTGIFNVVLELKASNFVSFYYFEDISGATDLRGIWSTVGVALGQQSQQPPDLSHASLFYTTSGSTGGPITAVPEPSSIFGTVAMLGMVGYLGYRKRKSSMKQVIQ